MKKHIPNIITLLNLFSGTVAITMAFQSNFKAVVVWVIIAALLDFIDGFAARLLNSYSDIGKDLDSLADVVSFGVAPASALFILLQSHITIPSFLEPIQLFIPYIAFIIPVFAAYRLAKFNNDDRQTDSFLGLPTPANGMFWISYCYAISSSSANSETIINSETVLYITIALIIILSLLMISDIPMFSLKMKKLGIRGNERQLLIIVLFLAFIILWGISGIAWSIIAYIAISILTPGKNHQSVK